MLPNMLISLMENALGIHHYSVDRVPELFRVYGLYRLYQGDKKAAILWERESMKRRPGYKKWERSRTKNHYKAKVSSSNPLLWWPCEHPELPGPSTAEQLIIDQLNRYRIKWYREVEFNGLRKTNHSYYRYDFLLQIPGRGIVLLEYDGAMAHCTAAQIENDIVKNEFCQMFDLPLIRYNKSHYYHMEREIRLLMDQYDIPLR